MRRTLAVATGITAGAVALALIATPALAHAASWTLGNRSLNTDCAMADGAGGMLGAQPGQGRGATNGFARPGGMGGGMGGGMALVGDLASGTLTAGQKASLAAMADDEKLAHDVYTSLAAKYPQEVRFTRIAQAESMHLTMVRTLIARYDVTDITAGLSEGTFAGARDQKMYGDLLAGATDVDKALAAGVSVEKIDIADLASATAGVTAPDVLGVYAHLLAGSQHHLAAFGG